jgi:UrcA family protein
MGASASLARERDPENGLNRNRLFDKRATINSCAQTDLEPRARATVFMKPHQTRSCVMLQSSKFRLALLAGAFVAASLPAMAQDYDGPESVTVTAPRFHADDTKVGGPLERVSLSGTVRYDDLNLQSYEGARELRFRVREEAQAICRNLAEAYPYYKMNGTTCYKDALDNALVKADEAIQQSRDYDTYRD